jgi:hypothetical protein
LYSESLSKKVEEKESNVEKESNIEKIKEKECIIENEKIEKEKIKYIGLFVKSKKEKKEKKEKKTGENLYSNEINQLCEGRTLKKYK